MSAKNQFSFGSKRQALYEEPSKGPHKDYERNLFRAREFMYRVQNSLPLGMRVYISGSQEIPESLLNIFFTPPAQAKMSVLGAPVFLHQPYDDVGKEMEFHFNKIRKVALKFWKDQESVLNPVESNDDW
jgi:hypothetical protein